MDEPKTVERKLTLEDLRKMAKRDCRKCHGSGHIGWLRPPLNPATKIGKIVYIVVPAIDKSYPIVCPCVEKALNPPIDTAAVPTGPTPICAPSNRAARR